MKKAIHSYTEVYTVLSFKLIELKLFRATPGQFSIEWNRGKNKAVSQLFESNEKNTVDLNLSYSCPCTMFFSKRKKRKPKFLKILVDRKEKKQTNFCQLFFDVTPFLDVEGQVMRIDHEMESGRSVHPVLVVEYKLEKVERTKENAYLFDASDEASNQAGGNWDVCDVPDAPTEDP
jgi:hypothetical protein